MSKTQNKFFSLISLLLVTTAIVVMTLFLNKAAQRQHLSHDLAELYHIKYGLLNADEWKVKAADILTKKIQAFQLSEEDGQSVRQVVEYTLDRVVTELDSYLDSDPKSEHWTDKVKGFLQDNMQITGALRDNLPQITDKIMAELEKEEVQGSIKEYLQKQVQQLIDQADRTVDDSLRVYIQQQHGYESLEEASTGLQARIIQLQLELWYLALGAIGLVVLVFLTWLGAKAPGRLHFLALILGAAVLLLGGVTTPMIDIDARVTELYFKVMGEEVRFTNQILFFQSKSIKDVVYLLIVKGDLQTLFVGLLILLFSVVFPLAKLIASYFSFNRMALIQNNKLVNFLVLKSGKWSMADVMVVAIFMAFIGFKGILKGQLGQLETSEDIEILTTHQFSNLQPGFLLFTCFVLAGLCIAVIMQRRLRRKG